MAEMFKSALVISKEIGDEPIIEYQTGEHCLANRSGRIQVVNENCFQTLQTYKERKVVVCGCEVLVMYRTR